MHNIENATNLYQTTNFDALCFIGGGAKGYVNPGSYKAFTEAGIIDNISTITGASVGALTATLIAICVDPETLHEKISERSTDDLLGQGTWWSGGKLQKDGSGLRKLLNDSITSKVSNFLGSNPDAANLSEDEKKIIENLNEKVTANNKDFNLRMSDLRVLNKLAPQKFKNLLVVAIDSKTESIHQFSSVDQTDFIKQWLRAVAVSKSIIDKTEFTEEDIQTLSQVFNMGLEWKDKQGKDLSDEIIKISDLQDEKIIKNCINHTRILLENEDLKTLAERSGGEEYDITKDDLAILKQADPSQDYSRIVNKDGKAEIYSNVSVVDATLASAALPGVLQNVEINGKLFADGGQLNNMPHNIIKTGKDSLVIGFNSDEMIRAIHSNSDKQIYNTKFIRRIFEAILRFFGVAVKKHNEQIKNRDFQVLRKEKALHAITNDIAGVDTTHFKRAQQEKDEGFLRGYFSTMNHLILYNYHPTAQEILKLEDEHRQSVISNNEELKAINTEIQKPQSQPTPTQEKTQLILHRLNLEEGIKSSTIPNSQLEQKAKDFQKFRENFEIRKFIFLAIDKYKGIDRKSDWYKGMIEFCKDEKNFEGEPQTVFSSSITKFIGKGIMLSRALSNVEISNGIISKKFEEYIASPASNQQIVSGVNKAAKMRTSWTAKLRTENQQNTALEITEQNCL